MTGCGRVPRHCIWFTVDDQEYLKQGGRVSPLVALAGGLLGIKPILQMDDAGHLIKVSTIRGRKKAIKTLEINTRSYPVKRRTRLFSLVTEIGPIIGSHSGPGTLAFFFVGKHR